MSIDGGYVSFNMNEPPSGRPWDSRANQWVRFFGQDEAGLSFNRCDNARWALEKHIENIGKIVNGLDRYHHLRREQVPIVEEEELVYILKHAAWDLLRDVRESGSSLPSLELNDRAVIIEGQYFRIEPKLIQQFEALLAEMKERLRKAAEQ